MKKYRTEEQTETAQARPVRFAANVLGDSDLASELEDLTPTEYAERKHIEIVNSPNRRNKMAGNGNGNGSLSKADLQDCIAEATSILEAAYIPEADRETLATAVGDALAALSGDAGDDEDDSDDSDGDDDQD